jgi:hypothetical protein
VADVVAGPPLNSLDRNLRGAKGMNACSVIGGRTYGIFRIKGTSTRSGWRPRRRPG